MTDTSTAITTQAKSALAPGAKKIFEAPLCQAWLEEPEAGFRPGKAEVYDTGNGLEVMARLEDEVIGNTVTRHNEHTWKGGDVFEIFLQVHSDAYYEIHITPENRRLLLRWPEGSRDRRPIQVDHHIIPDPHQISSKTWVDHEAQRWELWAHIPDAFIGTRRESGPAELALALARYDAAPGREKPFLSATPRFFRPRFHDRECWHRIVLPSPPLPVPTAPERKNR